MRWETFYDTIESFIKRVARHGERREITTLGLIFIFGWVIKLFFFAHFPGSSILRYDSYLYLVKSLEIAGGDWTPLRAHPIGLSVFTAPFFYFLKTPSIFVAMAYANFISLTVGALAVFPTYFLSKRLMGSSGAMAASILISISYWFVSSSINFGNEALFTISLLTAIFFLTKTKENGYYILASAASGAFGYSVRPNGIVVLAIIVISYFASRKRVPNYRHRHLIYAILVFFALSAPFLYQRYVYFGSAFSYGENSKYFVRSYGEVWGERFPNPPFKEFISSLTVKDYLNLFALRGVGAMLFILLMITAPLSIFFVWGGIISLSNRDFLPIHMVFIVWVLSFLPIFHLLGIPRHFFPLLPLTSIYTAYGIRNIVSGSRRPYMFFMLVMAVAAPFLLISFVQSGYYWIPLNHLKFGRWVATNIKGKIAIGRNNDLIMMNFPDTIVGGRGLFDLEAPQSGIATTYPGPFNDPIEIMPWFKEHKVTHLAIDTSYQANFALDTYTGKNIPPYWKLIYEDSDIVANRNIRLYEIDWKKYEIPNN